MYTRPLVEVPLLLDDEFEELRDPLCLLLGCLRTVDLFDPQETKNKANIKLANKNFFILLTNALS